jgi:hypothetical protein
MQVTIGKIASGLIAGGFAVFAIMDGGVDGLKCCAALLVPLALIWFHNEIGSATGYFAGHSLRVDVETPPILISIMGWIFLVGFPVLFYFLWRRISKKPNPYFLAAAFRLAHRAFIAAAIFFRDAADILRLLIGADQSLASNSACFCCVSDKSSFPSRRRWFDSHHPLQLLTEHKRLNYGGLCFFVSLQSCPGSASDYHLFWGILPLSGECPG